MFRRIIFKNDLIRKFQVFGISSNSTSIKLSEAERNEINHFNQLSSIWMNETGPVKVLHEFNQIRVPYIKKCIEYGMKNQNFNDIKLLEVGCGGGILSEPLSKLGLQVTGIDMAENLIEIAKQHALLNKINLQNLNYYLTSVEDFSEKNRESFDVLVASEVVEHITNLEHFLTESLKLLKPGGTAIITTINKTLLAKLYAIFLLEGLKVIPRGTHTYEKLVSPEALKNIFEKNSCRVVGIQGTWYNFLNGKFSLSDNTSVFYGLHAVKA